MFRGIYYCNKACTNTTAYHYKLYPTKLQSFILLYIELWRWRVTSEARQPVSYYLSSPNIIELLCFEEKLLRLDTDHKPRVSKQVKPNKC
jgi:hypothetical protein